MKKSKVALRVGVPLWMDEGNCAELLKLLRKYRGTVDELAFFTGFTHPPVPAKTAAERARVLKKVMPRFRKLGFSTGVNYLATLGHLDENLENSLDEPWQRMTDINGTVAKGSFCPADENFREYVAQTYIMYAKTKPDFIWVDDDLRMEGHAPVRFACFCEKCLELFSKETGTAWTREKLDKAFNSGSMEEKLGLRKKWLEHNRKAIDGILALIRKAVDSVDPSIKLGLMTADIYYSGREFRGWAETLSGKNSVEIKWRPGGGFYTDDNPCELLEKAHSIGRQVESLPVEVYDIVSELENFPYQKLKKSAKTVCLESAAYIGEGCTGVALNIIGTIKDSMDEYIPYFEGTKKYRRFFEEEVKAFGRSKCEGAGFAADRDCYATFGIDNSGWPHTGPAVGPRCVLELSQIGIPVAYAKGSSSVKVITEDCFASFSKNEIKEMLSGGVLADAPALKRLNELGMAEYTGFGIERTKDKDTREMLTGDKINGKFEGWERDCRQSFWKADAYILKPLKKESRVLSEAFDYADKNSGPLCGAFENPLGGRFAVQGYYPWTSLHSLSKSSQIKTLLRWLSKDTLPAYVSSFHKIAVWCRRDKKGRPALLLLNCSLDIAEKVRVNILEDANNLTLIHTDMSAEKIKRMRIDKPYSVFEIKELHPWEIVLLKVA
ncbi:hypothetical protein COY52_11180 [Candidatus Desantisbacteria bacterium CG_4_10_14_0_8_um_filter_48_22]|uniref:Beta-galactosidase trimerisation domain-containing protein n=1 Tax=Candidatus Desantisbacteria bacterium CG_4_10_14_0_8_um_filter_48_22 TaxID=1974543 RepID=A0A2M7S5R7_9BACT|nr:MAG: hypothetical protein COY52_11180 [Candidatus Desantisbacteria bacterium CG_4_10_14_0_8_um_filter_48_22]PJB28255.1 MAG: hypothetical protein CO111_02085 [Candidatus Desantisbacteria bacterium CG_4_9_14_3_um_filter_50_7]